MVKFTCDPAPDAHNLVEMDVDNRACQFWVQWDWDGVSVWPDCAGPLFRARVRNNTTTVTYYLHFLGRRGTPRTITLDPGINETRNAAWLAQRGLDSYADLDSLSIDQSPNTPTVVEARGFRPNVTVRYSTTSDDL